MRYNDYSFKFIHQKHIVSCFAKNIAIFFLKLALLSLREISDYCIVSTIKQLVKYIVRHSSFCNLSAHVAFQLHFHKDRLIVERCELDIEIVLFLDVRLKLDKICRLVIQDNSLRFPFCNTLTIHNLLIALLLNLFPQRVEVAPKHFRLDTASLLKLCFTKEKGKRNDFMRHGNFVQRQDEIWEYFLNTKLKCFYLNNEKRYNFDHQIETDSVSCSILLNRKDLIGQRSRSRNTSRVTVRRILMK